MRYPASAAAAIIGLCLLIFTLFILVFSIEKLAYIIDIFLNYGIDLRILARIYVSILPGAAEFLLPISITLACYVVILRKREAREFLILSGAGRGPGYFLVMTAAAATVAALLCLSLTGFVKPVSSQAFRHNYAEARANALTKGVPGGKFYPRQGSVMFVSGTPQAGGGDRLRVFDFNGVRLERLVASNCARLRSVGGNVVAGLCDAWIYLIGAEAGPGGGQDTQADARPEAGDCRLCTTPQGKLDFARVHVGPSSIAFEMGHLLGPITGRSDAERNLFDLLTLEDGRFASEKHARMAGGHVLLALICVLGAAAALAAVAATTRSTGPFALSGAIALVIAAMVVARSGALLVGPVQQPAYFGALMLGAAATCAAALVLAALSLHHRLVTPMFIRG